MQHPVLVTAACDCSLLTPHLVHAEQLSSVYSLEEEVPKLSIFCEDFFNQVFSSAPVVS